MNTLQRFVLRLAHAPAVLVRVHAAEGSVPRGPGAWMAVFSDALEGTIGGGRLEFDAIAEARSRLAGTGNGNGNGNGTGNGDSTDASIGIGPCDPDRLRRYPLGPSLGQCCGGVVHLAFDTVTAADADALRQTLAPGGTPVALFGGGHVGAALARVLAPLPFALTWIDSRDGIFPADVPAGVACEHSDPVQSAVPQLPVGARVLVMSFSHAEDLDIVAACLRRQRLHDDLPFVGLIGSRTKWATFRRRLEARGFTEAELARVTCPIGVPGIVGKQPEVIAVAVAAQLLQTLPPSREG